MTRPKTKCNTRGQWPDESVRDISGLQPGAAKGAIDATEKNLGVSLPEDLKAFLKWHDGGFVAGKRFVIYSAGKGMHPTETITASNQDFPLDYPLLNVARDATYEFGIKKKDLAKSEYPIYVFSHEFGTTKKIADSLPDFIEWMQVVVDGG